MHLAGLARRAGLANGKLGRSAPLQIPGYGLDQVGQQGAAAALPENARVYILTPIGVCPLVPSEVAIFQSIMTSPAATTALVSFLFGILTLPAISLFHVPHNCIKFQLLLQGLWEVLWNRPGYGVYMGG